MGDTFQVGHLGNTSQHLTKCRLALENILSALCALNDLNFHYTHFIDVKTEPHLGKCLPQVTELISGGFGMEAQA